MTKEQFKNKYGLTEDQFCGKEIIPGNLDMGSEIEIPDGFNPKVEGYINFKSLTSVGDDVKITAGGSIFLYSLTSVGDDVKITTGGYINLDSLTSMGNNVTINTGGYINLHYLTSMGDNVVLTARNSIHLSSLTAMGDNVTITSGAYIYINSLTSMRDNINITAGNYISIRSLTSMGDNINITAGNTIYLNSLTSVRDDVNITAGRFVETSLLSQANKPKITVVPELQNFVKTSDGKYIIADGILGELLHERNSVYKCKRTAQEEIFYVVTDGNGIYSHGESISDARDSLMYKLSERADKEQYRNLSLTHKLSFKDAIQCYRSITGACAYGVKSFIEKKDINKRKKYSIKEIVDLTVNEYGHDSFKEFFEAK